MLDIYVVNNPVEELKGVFKCSEKKTLKNCSADKWHKVLNMISNKIIQRLHGVAQTHSMYPGCSQLLTPRIIG